jgi:hypothetical protein
LAVLERDEQAQFDPSPRARRDYLRRASTKAQSTAGHGVFEYDQPSTTFGQFGDERVMAVAGLDAALERTLLAAAE